MLTCPLAFFFVLLLLLLLLLQDGQYRFHARVVGSGAAPGAEAVSGFTVDSVAPVVTIKGACMHVDMALPRAGAVAGSGRQCEPAAAVAGDQAQMLLC